MQPRHQTAYLPGRCLCPPLGIRPVLPRLGVAMGLIEGRLQRSHPVGQGVGLLALRCEVGLQRHDRRRMSLRTLGRRRNRRLQCADKARYVRWDIRAVSPPDVRLRERIAIRAAAFRPGIQALLRRCSPEPTAAEQQHQHKRGAGGLQCGADREAVRPLRRTPYGVPTQATASAVSDRQPALWTSPTRSPIPAHPRNRW
jgi:hypothetical protein